MAFKNLHPSLLLFYCYLYRCVMQLKRKREDKNSPSPTIPNQVKKFVLYYFFVTSSLLLHLFVKV